MNADVSRRERFKALFGAMSLAVIVVLLAPPVVQAATQAVKVKGNVKVVDTDGDAIESEAVPPMGLFDVEGSDGALAVRSYAGGGGFLGAADCTEQTENPALGPLENVVTMTGGQIATALLITGSDGVVTITADAVAGGLVPLANFTVNEDNPNFATAFGTGFTATSPVHFTCHGAAGGDGNANLIVLGQ